MPSERNVWRLCHTHAGKSAGADPSTSRGMCSRSKSVASNRRSDQLRDLVSSQLVPAESDMSDTASPTNHRRTKSSGNSTLSIRLNKSGPLRFTQTSLGAVNPGNTIYPLIDRKDGSEASSDASTSARVSFYKIDGRRAFAALSTSGICQTSCPLISCGVSDFRGAVFVFGVEPDWSSRLPVSGFA